MYLFPFFRGFFYFTFFLFSIVLLGLTAARIRYTTHLPPGDPLNHGHSFYDPIVAELMACSILGIFWAPIAMHMIHGRHEYHFMSKVWHEMLGVSILWIMWLVGAAISTSIWPNLPTFCSQFKACRILTAMVAFAWMGWIILTFILLTTLLYAVNNSSWREPTHNSWVREAKSRRASEYGQY